MRPASLEEFPAGNLVLTGAGVDPLLVSVVLPGQSPDGHTCVVAAFVPDEEELARLQSGQAVFVWVRCLPTAFPPVALTVAPADSRVNTKEIPDA